MEEREQAAHDQLFELDKKLRTGRYSQQVEAISSLDSYLGGMQHVPLVLSTAWLRLADFFSSPTTSNELRTHLVAALYSSCSGRCTKGGLGGHASEIIRRLGALWASNDVLARSLVLRFYGALAPAVADKAEVLYRVHESLLGQNQQEEEMDAALEAAHALVQACARVAGPALADALLSLLFTSSVYSHRVNKILCTLSMPTWDASTELLVVREIFRWCKEHPDSAPKASACLEAIQGRLGLTLIKEEAGGKETEQQMQALLYCNM